MTSSATDSRLSEILTPRVLAVLRLMEHDFNPKTEPTFRDQCYANPLARAGQGPAPGVVRAGAARGGHRYDIASPDRGTKTPAVAQQTASGRHIIEAQTRTWEVSGEAFFDLRITGMP